MSYNGQKTRDESDLGYFSMYLQVILILYRSPLTKILKKS